MEVIVNKQSFLFRLYVICMAIALPLHVFNMGGGDGLKPFHVPASIACVLSLIFLKKNDKLYRIVKCFLAMALVSSLLSYGSSDFSMWINMFIILTSCIGLAYVDLKRVLKFASLLIPIDVIVLYYHSIIEPQYRYQGFYSDPNYLCTTLIVFIFLLLLVYNNTKNKLCKVAIAGVLGLIYVLILLTISRTGLVCSLFLLLITSLAAIKKHFFKLVVVVIIGIWGLQHFATNFLDNQWGLMYERVFEADDNVEEAGSHRLDLSFQNIRYIFDHPQYILFGLGGGTTKGIYARNIPGLSKYRKSSVSDHNTWTSIFSEQGLICLILFGVIFYLTFNKIKTMKPSTRKYLSMGVFLSIFIFSFSIPQKTYLPFWWVIFFLNNQFFYNNVKH